MIKVWDLATRVYHWSQACLVIALILTGLNGGGSTLLHQALGALLLLLLIWRIIWGIVGSETSLFTRFVPSPSRLIQYLRGEITSGIGHNPAGGLMVILMMGLLLIQVATGLITSEFIDAEAVISRRFIRNVEKVHELSSWILIVTISLHIGAIGIYRLLGKPLINAMITGYQQSADRQPILESNIKAGLVFLTSTTVVVSLLGLLVLFR